MKELHLTIKQAEALADDLKEYCQMEDSHKRPLFKGFKVSCGDPFFERLCPELGLEMTPIPEFTEIDADE